MGRQNALPLFIPVGLVRQVCTALIFFFQILPTKKAHIVVHDMSLKIFVAVRGSAGRGISKLIVSCLK